MTKYYVTCGPPEAGVRQVVEAHDELGAAMRAFLRANYRQAARQLDPLVCVARGGFWRGANHAQVDCCYLDTLSVIRAIEQTREVPRCACCHRQLAHHE